ncbi:sulfur carrier protein ThiS [Aureivirga sp. CE67]|uniref:sulfur carrier protein ThiS n=1 Tax=Aureivirga sp. CE67 TaxID=1788983 RepID=UPI0018CA36C8|nr:sulfur carrier protein ThiS [Aureivirga sp. CE67]
MISINLNNQVYQIAEKSTLSNLLQEINQNIDGIAIAINEAIVSKANWSTTMLQNGDAILIIQATQGG